MPRWVAAIWCIAFGLWGLHDLLTGAPLRLRGSVEKRQPVWIARIYQAVFAAFGIVGGIMIWLSGN